MFLSLSVQAHVLARSAGNCKRKAREWLDYATA
jgi:hypothetical protein